MPGAIGCVGCIDLADMVRIAVVERVFLRYVTAELAVINDVSHAAGMEQYGFNRGFCRSDPLEDGLCHRQVEGWCAIMMTVWVAESFSSLP